VNVQGTFLIRLEEIESDYVERLAELETRVSEFVVRTGVCVLQCEPTYSTACCSVLRRVAAACCSMLKCIVAMCCSVLQC